MTMTREEAIKWLKVINTKEFGWDEYAMQESQREIRERCEQGVREAIDMAIEALNNEPILCKDCKHRNTWDNPRLEPQYYRCGRNVKFRDYGYVREDDYCSLGERREESEVGE